MNHHQYFAIRRKKWSMAAALMAFTCFPIQEVSADQMGRAGLNFTEIAREATPAVVSVKVKSTSTGHQGYNSQDPSDFFNDDFFSQFFGGRRHSFGRQQQQPRTQTSQGSGFIVSDDGYILTNGHVVNNADEITVTLNDEQEFDAKVIGIDTNTDIAVIKIEVKQLPFMTLGNSDDLEVGQWVIAIGNPLGLQASVTAGVVSAKGRRGLDLARIEDFIQTDAAINRGNSGGPLLNLKGEVIGMNTAIVSNMGSGGYMGIGFAIPSNMIQHIMEQLINDGSVTRGFIGVTLQQVNSDLAQAFGLDKAEGVLISDITNGSPAERAGLKQGDIILEYDHKKVSNITALRNAVSLMTPGSKMNLSVIRNGHRISISLTIGAYPETEEQAKVKQNKLGIEVEPLTPQIAQNMGYHNLEGVVVGNIDPNSPAALAGIKKGALIMAINHTKIKNVEEFKQLLGKAESDKPVLLLVKQGEFMHFVSIKAG